MVSAVGAASAAGRIHLRSCHWPSQTRLGVHHLLIRSTDLYSCHLGGAPTRIEPHRSASSRGTETRFSLRLISAPKWSFGSDSWSVPGRSVYSGPMLTERQIRREGGLGWSQQEVADCSLLSRNVVAQVERSRSPHQHGSACAARPRERWRGVHSPSGQLGEGVRTATPQDDN